MKSRRGYTKSENAVTFQIKDGEIWDVDYEDYH